MLKKSKYRILVQKHKNQIYSYAMYIMKNQMDAEDVTQEVLLKIWYNLEKINLLAIKSWIMRTTHNQCIDMIRRKKKFTNNEVSIDEKLEQIDGQKSSDDNPLLKLHNKLMSEKIDEEIKLLPENLRSVFVLYEIQGLKYKEISKTLDLPINSVKVYLLRARRKLQEALKKHEAQEVL